LTGQDLAAVALVPEPSGEVDQRSGLDRRSGENRRVFVPEGLAAQIIRSVDRRRVPSGVDTGT